MRAWRVRGMDQVFPRPGHPGSDGGDRAAAYLGGRCIIQAHYLSEHEGVAAVGVEPRHQFTEQDAVVESRPPVRWDAWPRRPATDLVGGDLPSDGQQPGAGRGTAGEARQRLQCSQVCLLGEIRGLGSLAHMAQEAVYITLRNPNERRQGVEVTSASG